MKQKQHSISEEHKHCATDRESASHPAPGRGPDRIAILEKQYEELCRLREQVQIAESRQRLLSHGSSHVGKQASPG
jgi:hypothetical protein